MQDAAIDTRKLDANVAELRVDVHRLARQRAALRAIGARAKRGGFGKDQGHKRVRILRFTEQRQQCSGTILFHLHGGCVHIECACRKGFFEKVAVDLRVHVIEIRFDDRNFFVEACDNFVASFADHDANDVWLPFELDRTCAITDRGNGHLGLWTERVAKCGNYGCASGRDQFSLHAV